MKDETKKLVQETWAQVVPISDKAAELFYGRLFELDPSLKFLFKGPIEVQGKMLMKALDGAVGGLDDLDALVPVLTDLGKRHAPYGVVDSDYDTVGAAFLWTLEQGLGEGFTDEVKDAWTEVYGVVAKVMKDAQAAVDIEGPISPREKRFVQGSWKAVVPIAEKAAEIFYAKLFEIDPALKPLFKGNMKEQGNKLMTMLTTAVKGLDKLDSIVPAVQDLGKRHVGYGVKDKDYDTVAEALLYTLGQGLGESFTDPVKEAWVKVYTVLSTTMKDAARDAESPAGGASAAQPLTASPEDDGGIGIGMLATGVLAGVLVVAAFL